MKGNRHTELQRDVSERNRRVAAALSAEMGSLSRSITRRSGQNCKIKIQNSDFAILQAGCQTGPCPVGAWAGLRLCAVFQKRMARQAESS